MYTHQKNIITAGVDPAVADKAVIFIHGRGSTADDIISLAKHFKLADAALYAPQAVNNSWYPLSFIAPVAENQPALDSAIAILKELVRDIISGGIPPNQIYFLGFSQGACLTLEFLARNAQQYGGAVAFTGGLIGKDINMNNYKGDFKKTPILITTGDPDPHVPLRRVELSEGILRKLNADVTLRVFAGKPHTIAVTEIELARAIIG
jgi:phospholipase/carboxylesterase